MARLWPRSEDARTAAWTAPLPRLRQIRSELSETERPEEAKDEHCRFAGVVVVDGGDVLRATPSPEHSVVAPSPDLVLIVRGCVGYGSHPVRGGCPAGEVVIRRANRHFDV